jgi:hypothetical protein
MGLKLNRRVEQVQADPSQLVEPAPVEPVVTEISVVRPARPDGPVIKQEAPAKKTRLRRLAG